MMPTTKIDDFAIYVCKTLKEAGYQAWIVGGAPRDLFMRRPVHDWDVATDATPDEVDMLFKYTFPLGIEHGTIAIVCDPKKGLLDHIEVTTFRADGDYSDGRHPDEVKFGVSLEEDLAHRDFTMNAIAYDPITDTWVDPFEGDSDIRAGIINAVGNPDQRFNEDGLRLLRACRFAAQLDFRMGMYIHEAIVRCASNIHNVSKERISMELDKILLSPVPSIGFDYMASTGLLDEVLPALAACRNIQQHPKYHVKDVYGHTMLAVDKAPSDLLVRWACLLHDIGKPAALVFKNGYPHFYGHEDVSAQMAQEILTDLRKSRKFIKQVIHLIQHHMVGHYVERSDATIRNWMQKVGKSYIEPLLQVAQADLYGSIGDFQDDDSVEVKVIHAVRYREFDAFVAKIHQFMPSLMFTVRNLPINGHDVLQAGIPGGQTIKECLAWCLKMAGKRPDKYVEKSDFMPLLHEFKHNLKAKNGE